MKQILFYTVCLLLVFAPAATAQLQLGNDAQMSMTGNVSVGYAADNGDFTPSTHSVVFGANANLVGDYYNPNFLNYTVSPYFNRSTLNSESASLTDASGVNANLNLFSGSRYPGNASYQYAYNSTSLFGNIAGPNFTTVGNSSGFGVGWSALLPNKPTISVGYSHGDGTGTVYGTNETLSSSSNMFTLNSTYQYAGWLFIGYFTNMDYQFQIPTFLSGEATNQIQHSSGNNFGIGASRPLPWNGELSITYNYSNYDNHADATAVYGSSSTNYSTNAESATAVFHPTHKLSLTGSESFVDNLTGYFYQNIENGGGGVPVTPQNTPAYSFTVGGGASYNFLPNLYGTAQLTNYNQSYLGRSYSGNYLSGTLGYSKRILHTFALSATVINGTSDFQHDSTGFIANVNGYHRFGPWETSGDISYAQNIQTSLITYTTSYYNYGLQVHRKFADRNFWFISFNGSHSGLNNTADTDNSSLGVATSLTLYRKLTLSANYSKSDGQALLTSTGIVPIPPTPGLLPEGLIVYNGRSYGGGLTWTPLPRLSLTGNYTNAQSQTLSDTAFSLNKQQILYSQFQYRFRRISMIGGYTRFFQSVSAAQSPGATNNSYYIGVTRWFGFF